MRMQRPLIRGLATALLFCIVAGGAARAQARPRANPALGAAAIAAGVGPVEKFADVSGTPQGQFLEGGAFDTQGNLWFVAIGSGWVSYLTPDGKLVPSFTATAARTGSDLRAAGHPLVRGQALSDHPTPGHPRLRPQTKEVKTLVYTYRNQLFKDPTTSISTPKVTFSSPTLGNGPGQT